MRRPIPPFKPLPGNACGLLELTRGFSARVSSEDADLALHRWHAITAPRSTTIYAGRHMIVDGKGKALLLHRVILERKLGRPLARSERVDHIDRDGLNNTRSNLRLCSQSQNACNRKSSAPKSSRFKGVDWHKGNRRWRARIQVDGRSVHLGHFHSEIEAALAYDKAAWTHFRAFAYLNFPARVEAA